jgi:uncharacterized protein DUF2877
VPQSQPTPAWASTSVGRLIAGDVRTGTVFAAGPAASYVALPDDDGPDLLLALLVPGAVRLPIGVCLTEGPLPARGAAVRVGNGRIATPDRTWRPVRWWDPRPHLDVDALFAGAGALIDVIRAEPDDSFGLPLDDALAVAAALAGAESNAAYGVLGLGPGLTPSGDDVVAGALAVLAIAGRLDNSVREAVERLARTRTTALSAALVAAAGRGEMIPQAARLLAAVAAREPDGSLASAARSLFAVGSTSGHDLAAGMAGALRSVA